MRPDGILPPERHDPTGVLFLLELLLSSLFAIDIPVQACHCKLMTIWEPGKCKTYGRRAHSLLTYQFEWEQLGYVLSGSCRSSSLCKLEMDVVENVACIAWRLCGRQSDTPVHPQENAANFAAKILGSHFWRRSDPKTGLADLT